MRVSEAYGVRITGTSTRYEGPFVYDVSLVALGMDLSEHWAAFIVGYETGTV